TDTQTQLSTEEPDPIHELLCLFCHALRQCRHIQNMVDISSSSLQALRTRCTKTNDLTRQEIRTLEVQKLKQKHSRPQQDQNQIPIFHKVSFPRSLDELESGKLSVDGLLQMSNSELEDTMRRLGSNSEDCSRLTAALSCLKSADESGVIRVKADSGQNCRSEPQQDVDLSSAGSPSASLPTTNARSPVISISVPPSSDDQRPHPTTDEAADIFTLEPSTQTSKMRGAKPSNTPPASSRKLLQLLPNIAMARSRSQETQLANRIEEPAVHRWVSEEPCQVSAPPTTI
uniref:Kinase suppressor RAS 1 N-terminal helical hairpin domain-containing protein n=1 Tax=Echeneis naucrates TaxID=173247 RepID=A0A665VVW4_ECHNA